MMSIISKFGVLAFVLASVACGGTDETSSSPEQVESETTALARNSACPNRPPLQGTGCLQDQLICTYHTDQCPKGTLTAFVCQSNGSNLVWAYGTRCIANH